MDGCLGVDRRHQPPLEEYQVNYNRWISEQVDQRKSNVDGVAIREKARSIYDHLAEKEPSGSSPAPGFIASHGWFHRFKQRFSLHNIARTAWLLVPLALKRVLAPLGRGGVGIRVPSHSSSLGRGGKPSMFLAVAPVPLDDLQRNWRPRLRQARLRTGTAPPLAPPCVGDV
ncbi:hypothetical protein GWK47_010097 [Chionoecetes opilio]|uniref:HTH CENPB-type domain-containing protein n=1 Tax=Chionoecetes opilio TaxID=41210 RepID=A0A8J5CNA4_CHIOP|nr:hypothetical protein GWK47_010097 [Chionoecetes opilio]